MNTENIIDFKNVFITLKKQTAQRPFVYDVCFEEDTSLNFTSVSRADALIDAKRVYEGKYGNTPNARIVLKTLDFVSETERLDMLVDIEVVNELIANIDNIIKYCDADCDTMYLHSLKSKLQSRFTALVDSQSNDISVKYDTETEEKLKKFWIDELYYMFNPTLYSEQSEGYLMSYAYKEEKLAMHLYVKYYDTHNLDTYHNKPTQRQVFLDYIKNNRVHQGYEDVQKMNENDVRWFIDAYSTNDNKECYEPFNEQAHHYCYSLRPNSFCRCVNKKCKYNIDITRKEDGHGRYISDYKPSPSCALKLSIAEHFEDKSIKIESFLTLDDFYERGYQGKLKDIREAASLLKDCEWRAAQSKELRTRVAKGLLIERALQRYKIDDSIKTSLFRILKTQKTNKGLVYKAHKLALDTIIVYIKKDFLRINKHLVQFL